MAKTITFAQYTSTIYPGNQGAVPMGSNPTLYVPHQEIQYGASKGPEESFGDNGHAKRVLRCRWQDRMTLVWQLLGGPIILGNPGVPTAAQATTKWSGSWTITGGGGASTGDILVLSPHQYPYNTALYCANVSVAPEGNPVKGGALSSLIDTTLVPTAANVNTVSNFDHAILTCDYISPPTSTGQTTGYSMFFKENISPSTEFITLPRNNLYWDAGQTIPINVNEAPGFEIKRWIWTVTRRKVVIAGPLAALISPRQGCVNSDSLSTLFGGSVYGAGSLIFEGGTLEPDSLNDGTPALKVEMKFKVSTVDWNKFPHVMGGGGSGGVAFSNIYDATGARFYLFPTSTLAPLISSSYF